MGRYVVFNDVEWKPPISSKLITAPVLKIKVDFDDVDLKEMVGKQRSAFDAEFKKFDADFNKLGTQKMKEVQDAVKWTEERIAKKGTAAERKEVAANANKMLEQAFKVFQDQITKLAQKHFDLAVEKSQKVMKMKIVKARAKAIAKIVIIVALTLTATALAIAATVATGGIAAPAIIAALVAGAKAGMSVYKTITTEWPNATNQMKVIQTDIDALTKAAKTLEENRNLATTGHQGALDNLKKAQALFEGNLVNLDKHVGQLDKYVFLTSDALKKQQEELNKLTDKINASGDKALQAKANKLLYETMQGLGALRRMDDVKNSAVEVKAAWARNNSVGDLGALQKAVQFGVEVTPTMKQVVTLGKEVYTGAGKLAEALK